MRFSDVIERDMVQVRLTGPFRFVVVGAEAYLARRDTPERPEDLLRHDCITFRSQTTGALYACELERGRRTWRVPVRGAVVTNDGTLSVSLAERGLGLAYAFGPVVMEQLRAGRLQMVLERYAPTVPGYFLYFPSRHEARRRCETTTACTNYDKQLWLELSAAGSGRPLDRPDPGLKTSRRRQRFGKCRSRCRSEF